MKRAAYACASTRTARNRSFSCIILTVASASSELAALPGSLKAARNRARELHRIVDKGCDPVGNERDRRWITSFEKFLRHVAERVPTKARLSPKQIK
jgi:hypothetical protein